MQSQLEKIRETQKESWNKSSSGWKKWDELMMSFLRPMGDEMIQMLELRDDDTILDVATGTGEPGLTIATRLPYGKVIGIDLAEHMLAVAIDNAHQRNIQNFVTITSDVTTMPFAENTFDGISCRLGFMFFPDMKLAMEEMIRVLKQDGRIVASVWNAPSKNSWISTSMSTMMEVLQLSSPPANAPGLFRCSEPGSIESLFVQYGLKNINVKEVTGTIRFTDLPTYWSFITEVACPMAFKTAAESLKEEIRNVVFNKLEKQFGSSDIILHSSASVIAGEKY